MDERTLKLETALTQIAKLLTKEEAWTNLTVHKSADDSLEVRYFKNGSFGSYELTNYWLADGREEIPGLSCALADLAVILDEQGVWTDFKFHRLREDDAVVTIVTGKEPSYRLLSAHYPDQAGLPELGFRVMEFR